MTILSAMLALSLIPAAPVATSAPDALTQTDEASFTQTLATIIEYDKEYQRLVLKTTEDDNLFELHVGDDTFVVDAYTGLNTTLEDRLNDDVSVYHTADMSEIVIRSPEPSVKGDALAIIVNIPDFYTPPRFHIVEEVEDTGEVFRLTVDNGGLIVSLGGYDGAEAASITTSAGEGAPTSDIAVGTKLLLWYEHVALSHPALTTAQRAVLLKPGQETTPYDENAKQENEYNHNAYDYKAYNDYEPKTTPQPYTPAERRAYTLNASFVHNYEGQAWVPLRRVAEAMGCTVIWHEKDKTATVSLCRGNQAYVVIDKNGKLYNDTTYVSLAFFETYFGKTVAFPGGIAFYRSV